MTLPHALFPPGEIPISGEVQFWRMHPDTWETALQNVHSLGITTIATYLSWRRHEPTPGTFDLRGGHGPELDVHRFLSLCRDIGLRVILKPGPWICAEEPGGGFPDWVIEDDTLIALDYQGNPVSGYNPPFKHPMPSYASLDFRAHVSTWIHRVWDDLEPFLGDGGPIVATQYDNEPSLGFQDTMYGFDHHPDAIASWNTFVGSVVSPPRPRTGDPVAPTPKEALWMEWQRHYIADYLDWLRQTTIDAGAGHLAGTINLNTHPVRGWPQDGGIIAQALDGTVVGEDHYFIPPLDEDDLAGLALAAAQARTTATPLVWAPEMQAGIWRSPDEQIDYPDPTITEMTGWWSAALALGYRGFNLYMLVNRENWELAPISNDGTVTALGEALRHLLAVIQAVPDLADYEPVSTVTLPWSTDIRESAYRVRGTQAAPLTPWDLPDARRAYGQTESAAREAVTSGHQLDLHAGPAQAPADVAVTTPPGVLARVHQRDDGQKILFVVTWSRSRLEGPVDLTVRSTSRWRHLVDVTTARMIHRSDTGFRLDETDSTLALYRIVEDDREQ